MKSKNFVTMIVLLAGAIFLITTLGVAGSRDGSSPQRRVQLPAAPERGAKPPVRAEKMRKIYKVSVENIGLTKQGRLTLQLKNIGDALNRDEHRQSYLTIGRGRPLSLAVIDPEGRLRVKGQSVVYTAPRPLLKKTTIKVAVRMFNGARITQTKLLQPTCSKKSKGIAAGAASKAGLAPKKRGLPAGLNPKPGSLTIKKAYIKHNLVHVVLQPAGHVKATPQGLSDIKLVIKQGAKFNKILLKNNLKHLRPLMGLGKEVDFNTQIRVVKGIIPTAYLVGVHNFTPLKKKVVVTGEVKKVIKTEEVTPWKMKKKFAHPFWHVSSVSIGLHYRNQYGLERQYWYTPGKTPWYDIIPVNEQKFSTYIHNPINPHSILLHFDVDVTIKSIPKNQVTKEDVAKWGSGTSQHFDAQIVVQGPNGELPNETNRFWFQKHFTWEDVQKWPDEGIEYSRDSVVHCSWEVDISETDAGRGKISRLYRVITKVGHIHSDLPEFFFFFEDTRPMAMIPPDSSMWILGSIHAIKWRVHGIKHRMRIVLFRAEYGKGQILRPYELIGTIAKDIVPPPPGSGTVEMSYQWHVGDLIGHPAGIALGETQKTGEAAEKDPGKRRYLYYIRVTGDGMIAYDHNKDYTMMAFIDPHEIKKATKKLGADHPNQIGVDHTKQIYK